MNGIGELLRHHWGKLVLVIFVAGGVAWQVRANTDGISSLSNVIRSNTKAIGENAKAINKLEESISSVSEKMVDLKQGQRLLLCKAGYVVYCGEHDERR